MKELEGFGVLDRGLRCDYNNGQCIKWVYMSLPCVDVETDLGEACMFWCA
ncbi:hypothetical protein [Vibrio splendidus]|nr:hypothetical protein [Vibrio splendidus]